MSVTLYLFPGENGPSENFSDSQVGLHDNFKSALVGTGTWIFYTWPHFNIEHPGCQEDNIKILQPGESADISSVNGSMYLVPDNVNGLVLFEHAFYGGVRKLYDQDCPDVTRTFPQHVVAGVTSAIVLAPNQQWKIYAEVNYEGLSAILQPRKWYPHHTSIPFPNDTVASLRRE